MSAIDYPTLLRTMAESSITVYDTPFDKLINDVQKNVYTIAPLINGKSKEQLTATGPRIKDRVYLQRGRTMEPYSPGKKREVAMPQVGNNHDTHWAFYVVDKTWTEQDIEMNVPQGMSKEGAKSAIKSFMAQLDMDVDQALIDGMDDCLWKTPNYDTMGKVSASGTGSQPAEVMSIPCFINEYPNGLHTSMVGYTDWADIHGLSPANLPEWVCQQIAYNNADASFADEDEPNNLLAALDRMHRRLKFRRPSKLAGHMQPDTAPSDQAIITGESGYDRLTQALRKNRELFLTVGDRDISYGTITVGGTEVMEYRDLDSKALYDDGSGVFVTSEVAVNPGPRFYFINGKYLDVKFHRNKMIERRKPREPDGMIETWHQPIVLWWQTWPKSLRRHGIVYPETPESSVSSEA